MATIISHSPAETEAVAASLAARLEPGTVIGLQGDLGAGKTCFVKGLARALGCPARVHSPTFSLIHHYDGGKLPLYHLDLYRLDSSQAIVDAGLAEYFQPDGVAVIEWIDRWQGPLPAKYLRVDLGVGDDGDTTRRTITYDHPLP